MSQHFLHVDVLGAMNRANNAFIFWHERVNYSSAFSLLCVFPAVPIDSTAGIKMLYVFVDIQMDNAHFLDTVKFNFPPEKSLALVSTIQFVAALQVMQHFFSTNLFTCGCAFLLQVEPKLTNKHVFALYSPIRLFSCVQCWSIQSYIHLSTFAVYFLCFLAFMNTPLSSVQVWVCQIWQQLFLLWKVHWPGKASQFSIMLRTALYISSGSSYSIKL